MKTQGLTVRAAVISHIGCVRTNNEDNFYMDGQLMQQAQMDKGAWIELEKDAPEHLFAICDGMGGLNGGEFASAMGVQALAKLDGTLKSEMQRSLLAFVKRISQAVYEDGQSRNEQGREGTTLALLHLRNGVATVANVGDSRVYMLRLGKLVQLSRDHTLVFSKMLQGKLTREEMRKDPTGNQIYQYLGQEADKITDDSMYYRECALCNGDRFMLCSDGVSDLIPHAQLEKLLTTSETPGEAANALVRTALELGGKDNTTCMVGDICAPGLPFATVADVSALDLFAASATTQDTTL